jgi:hypothetical protein
MERGGWKGEDGRGRMENGRRRTEDDAGHPREGRPAVDRIGRSKKVNQAGVKAMTGTGTTRACGSGACIRRSISRTLVLMVRQAHHGGLSKGRRPRNIALHSVGTSTTRMLRLLKLYYSTHRDSELVGEPVPELLEESCDDGPYGYACAASGDWSRLRTTQFRKLQYEMPERQGPLPAVQFGSRPRPAKYQAGCVVWVLADGKWILLL